MKALYCDICGKEIIDPITGRNYWHIKEFDICEDCKDKAEFQLRPIIRNHFPFSQAWYENEFIGLLEAGAADQE